ncbi:Recombination-associated protein RdgC [Corallococcus coralloides]|uniref:Recombination-associated protein RdgC n=1 Tax=Corallococcus coralloides TaxID=184914 RepID=A0A410RWM6_CORCK|nr:recombination-associated protein RdgC [Corallococcus coralloides]QAT86232.1 Recombination-associated protein RdgC [Corallococcus coralloides]
MPVLRGAVTFSRFRTEPAKDAPSDVKRWMTKGLKSHAFEPIDRRSEEERAAGFVELENPESSEFATGNLFYGEYALFSFRIDTLKVPASMMKSELDKWAAAFGKENGRPPARAEKNKQRAELKQLLRQRAVPRTSTLDVTWNLKTHTVQVWAASRKTVDEICVALEGALAVKVIGITPASMAQRAGIDEKALGPTAELIGMDLPATASVEDTHGEA